MELSKLFSVEGKVVLVTGGGRGIGKMIAEGFTRNGAKVYVASRSLDVCQETAAELTAQGPGSCIALHADLSTEEGCAALAKEISDRETRLDVLVNDCGVAYAKDFKEHTTKEWDSVFNVNVKSYFFLTRDLLPLLDVSASAQGDAHVINIGSVGGLQPQMMNTFSYDASKAAVHQLTRVLASKLAKRPNGGCICVNAIAPGVVPTRMTQPVINAMHSTFEQVAKNATPMGRCGQPTDLAGVALFLGSHASAWITGDVICADGGMTYATSAHWV